ncbi:hypothetical protein [Roseomonas fluvialis]|uniref:Uncharacterized protein n=1 Tax=Roseomonas fluvialis TaxID=1750527 RepID=A0ABM7Y772_9PROT|nr:hypothetical protein [Roseomonas fluvialis]BDG73786.1 hypothetical protein Rmf_37150 [Roseomonas fluvialis]
MRRAGENHRPSPAAWRGAAVVLACAGCAAPPPPDGSLHVAFDISGRVERRGVVLTHAADAFHRCLMPVRTHHPDGRDPSVPRTDPPNVAHGYTVFFAPRFDGVAVGLAPEWVPFGPQSGFTLDVLPRAGALETPGPVLLGRAFTISVGTPEGRWERSIAETDPPSAGSVRIDADGMGGHFRATGLVQQIPHNRLPDTEAISVTGTWRCPAR